MGKPDFAEEGGVGGSSGGCVHRPQRGRAVRVCGRGLRLGLGSLQLDGARLALVLDVVLGLLFFLYSFFGTSTVAPAQHCPCAMTRPREPGIERRRGVLIAKVCRTSPNFVPLFERAHICGFLSMGCVGASVHCGGSVEGLGGVATRQRRHNGGFRDGSRQLGPARGLCRLIYT